MTIRSRTTRSAAEGRLAPSCILGACLLMGGAANAQEPGVPLDGARTALQELIETRRVISGEKRDWAIAREVLEDRIELLQEEIAGLRERIGEAQGSIVQADEKRAQMLADHGRLEEATTALVPLATALEERTRELMPRLPQPLVERIKPLAQRLPEDAAATKLGVGERFMPIVGILNEIDKFNREVAVVSEVRTLESGAALEVTAFYLGIGQAYYVNADGTAAGAGRPGEQGWTWKAIDAAAAQVTRAIAILQSEEVAAFVQLPLTIE